MSSEESGVYSWSLSHSSSRNSNFEAADECSPAHNKKPRLEEDLSIDDDLHRAGVDNRPSLEDEIKRLTSELKVVQEELRQFKDEDRRKEEVRDIFQEMMQPILNRFLSIEDKLGITNEARCQAPALMDFQRTASNDAEPGAVGGGERVSEPDMRRMLAEMMEPMTQRLQEMEAKLGMHRSATNQSLNQMDVQLRDHASVSEEHFRVNDEKVAGVENQITELGEDLKRTQGHVKTTRMCCNSRDSQSTQSLHSHDVILNRVTNQTNQSLAMASGAAIQVVNIKQDLKVQSRDIEETKQLSQLTYSTMQEMGEQEHARRTASINMLRDMQGGERPSRPQVADDMDDEERGGENSERREQDMEGVDTDS